MNLWLMNARYTEQELGSEGVQYIARFDCKLIKVTETGIINNVYSILDLD